MAFHEELRNHRLKKGLILEEISEETKINVRILQALEQGNFHILPIPYVRLFMKAYAQAIDYPVEDIIRGLENELQLTGEQAPVPQQNLDTQPQEGDSGITGIPSSLLGSKNTQNSALRLIVGLLILIVIIVIGKNLLQPSAEPISSTTRSLPQMNVAQALDSLLISSEGDTLNPRLTIDAQGYLSLISTRSGQPADTIHLDPTQRRVFTLNPKDQIALFPSESALIVLRNDTLPVSPFNNSWLVLDHAREQTRLLTYGIY